MADKSGVLDKCKVVNTFNETETRQATLINNQWEKGGNNIYAQ